LNPYRGRFAPSPTGPLHFGSLVAAVASYLEAHVHEGEWLVRVEDLDRPRVARGAAEDILRTLEAFGMRWHGTVVYQSTRSDAYHAALHELRRCGRIYACACSRREIADSGITGIEGFVYPAACRDGLPAGRSARAWRVNTAGAKIGFDDAIQGRLEHDLERQIGDFVLYRADSVYAYQLAVSVDDAEQGVTDVMRGADLFESTPRQIYLQQLLGLPTPRYAHLPVALNAQREKLSKQTLAKPVNAADAAGLILSVLRFLGHKPPVELEMSGLDAVWQWARANWSLDLVPRMRAQRSPTL
jgi:glutamyl-Q tRNA(Asp) synthetase